MTSVSILPLVCSLRFTLTEIIVAIIIIVELFTIIILFIAVHDMKMSQEKSKTIPVQIFWGVKKRCIMAFVQVVNQNFCSTNILRNALICNEENY